MARIVDAVDINADRRGEFGRFADYPWETWTDGNPWEVLEGEDFSVGVKTFRVYLYQYKDLINAGLVPNPDPKVKHWTVRTRIVAPGTIRFRFEPDYLYEEVEEGDVETVEETAAEALKSPDR